MLLNAFWRLHKLPIAFRRLVKNSLFGSAQTLLDGLVRQNVQMIEEEHQAYLQHPIQRNLELNRALDKSAAADAKSGNRMILLNKL